MAQKIYGIDFGTDTIKIYKKGQGIILIEKNMNIIRKNLYGKMKH